MRIISLPRWTVVLAAMAVLVVPALADTGLSPEELLAIQIQASTAAWQEGVMEGCSIDSGDGPVNGLPATSFSIIAPGRSDARRPADSNIAEDTSLTAMVAAFNERAALDPTGKDQTPLTADEVAAAIQGWVRELGPDVTDEIFARYQDIADTGHAPPGTRLSASTRWHGYRDRVFQVWWIDLELMNDEGPLAYVFRLRDRKIASRPLSNTEQAEHQQQQERYKAKLLELSPQAYRQTFPDEAGESVESVEDAATQP